MQSMDTAPALSDVRYVKTVTVGGINPNNPLTLDMRDKQVALLNRCLNDYPRGMIIGKDISIGSYNLGEHRLTMEQTVYHVGFTRKPAWLEDKDNGSGGV